MNKLFHESMDAREWASAWMEIIADKPDMHLDEGAMLGWFANALERGRTTGMRALEDTKVPKNWFHTYGDEESL
jgi:hypothetical protein